METRIAELRYKEVICISDGSRLGYVGDLLPEPEAPARKGYKFTGWYLEDGSKFDFSTPVQTDLVLTAGWEKDNSSHGFNSWLDWSISIYKYTVTKWLDFIGSWWNPFGC